MMVRVPSVFETYPVSTLYTLVGYASRPQLALLYKQINFVLHSSEVVISANRRFALLRLKKFIFACSKTPPKKHRTNVAPPSRF